MINDGVVLEDLLDGEKAICFFVNKGVFYWVLDYKYNFSLDAEKDYRAYLSAGDITQDQYLLSCEKFRGGTLRLNSDNFLQYLEGGSAVRFSRKELEFFLDGGEPLHDTELLRRVEMYYSFGDKLSAEDFRSSGILMLKLPLFYINFDREIYMHMDFGRSHESLAYPNWSASLSDFSFLIPDSECYWRKKGDLWKLRFVQLPAPALKK